MDLQLLIPVVLENGGKNGKRHRDDGPAVIFSNGLKMWYLNGKFIKETTENISRVKSARHFFLLTFLEKVKVKLKKLFP